ncbi:hypothetical protein QPK87_31665 [Kamptonema cortianum]|nr:hypothetical protein [Geitlerinema splendidum]MDK3161083.1 hypothetical protein [Kamptonema cortianum]
MNETSEAHENPGECLSVVEVAQGGMIELTVVQSGTSVNAGERLSAEFGDVLASGVYQAPSELPPFGLDYVTVSDEEGVPLGKLVIQIVPSYGFVDPSQVVVPASSELDTEVPSSFAAPIDDPANYGTHVDEVLIPSERTLAPPLTLAGLSGYELPIEPIDPAITDPTLSSYVVLARQTQPMTGKKCGVFPKPTGTCTNGAIRRVPGPYKVHLKAPQVLASVSGTAFGFSGDINYWKMVAWKVRYIDYWKCIDGKWVFCCTKKCTISGSHAWSFDPSSWQNAQGSSIFARVVLGYTIEGYKWDYGERCIRINKGVHQALTLESTNVEGGEH